ncbi:hypothetical protein Syun_017611 [Stephania yunnanensis]|uniref:Uncharacterized protein n=1 Tax=Stephania yunnanensis TaxID=152371 RepID=A0AAP0P3I9_9MAGN
MAGDCWTFSKEMFSPSLVRNFKFKEYIYFCTTVCVKRKNKYYAKKVAVLHALKSLPIPLI